MRVVPDDGDGGAGMGVPACDWAGEGSRPSRVEGSER